MTPIRLEALKIVGGLLLMDALLLVWWKKQRPDHALPNRLGSISIVVALAHLIAVAGFITGGW